jgi:hypothetical protein
MSENVKIQSTEYRVQNTEYRLQIAEYTKTSTDFGGSLHNAFAADCYIKNKL